MRAIAAVDQLHGYAVVVLAPWLVAELGVGTGALAAVTVWRAVAFLGLAGVVAGRARPRVRDGGLAIARLGGLVRAGALVLAGLGGSIWAVLAALVISGASLTTVTAVHPLDDPRHQRAARLGNVGVPLLVGILATVLEWRAVFVVLGLIAALPCLVRARPAVPRPEPVPDPVARVLARPRLRRGAQLAALLGMVEMALYVWVFVELHRRLGLGPALLGVIAAAGELAGVVANARAAGGAVASPRRFVGIAIVTLAAGHVALIVALVASDSASAVVALLAAAALCSTAIPFLAVGTRVAAAGALSPVAPVVVGVGATALLLAVDPAVLVGVPLLAAAVAGWLWWRAGADLDALAPTR